jgi:hypothetical protein
MKLLYRLISKAMELYNTISDRIKSEVKALYNPDIEDVS